MTLDLIEDQVSYAGGGFGQNALIFGADKSTSIHIDNKKKRHISPWKGTNARITEYSITQLTLQ